MSALKEASNAFVTVLEERSIPLLRVQHQLPRAARLH